MNRRVLVTGAAVLIAAVLLWYSLRGTDWHAVGRLLSGARWPSIALVLAMATVALVLRALRWRLLLTAEGAVSATMAFRATSAGYFGNNFLPARAGELIRTLMISSQAGLSRAYVLATALFERVADAIALVVIASGVLLIAPAQPSWLTRAVKPFGMAGLACIAAVALMPRLESRAQLALVRIPIPQALRGKLSGILENCLNALRAFHDPGRLAKFLAFTIAIWVIDAVGTILGAHALGLTMPPQAAFLLIAALGLGSALPSTPGYVGIYQFVAVTVLAPFGFSRTDAIAYILLAQTLSWLLVAFWGGLSMVGYRRQSREIA